MRYFLKVLMKAAIYIPLSVLFGGAVGALFVLFPVLIWNTIAAATGGFVVQPSAWGAAFGVICSVVAPVILLSVVNDIFD